MATADGLPPLSDGYYHMIDGADYTARTIWDDPEPKRVDTGLLWPDGSHIYRSFIPLPIGFIRHK